MIRINSKRILFYPFTILLILLFAIGLNFFYKKIAHKSFAGKHIKCVIAINSTKFSLLPGLNYELLKEFAKDADFSPEILLAQTKENYIDSLKYEKADIVILNTKDTINTSDLLISAPVGDDFIWIVNKTERLKVKKINDWFSKFSKTDKYNELNKRFRTNYNPISRSLTQEKYKHLSPYDEQIKRYAIQIEWDRKLLTALIYQESKFSICARSYKGAMGMMQIMPRTANHYGWDDIIDPEASIKAGTAYLKKLQRKFRKYAKNKIELQKFTMAAYNAGASRIMDCIMIAEEKGTTKHTWKELCSIMPMINFNYSETTAYVENIMKIYSILNEISIEP